MNILVTIISRLPAKRETYTYELRNLPCTQSSIQAVHTNESILRCLACYKPLVDEGGIHKIIALVSDLVTQNNIEIFGKTAFEYYQEQVTDCGFNPKYCVINYEQTDLPDVLNQICEEIKRDDKVYIDSAGGARNISDILQLLTKILKYKNIKNPCNLYSSRQEGNTFHIVSTENFTRMTDLADGFHEFKTTGKADQLENCFKNINTAVSIRQLLSAMREFSDKIRIGQTDTLDATLDKLRKAIVNCKNHPSTDSVESVLLNQFIPIIQDDLIGIQEKQIDYIQIITWCINNVLIQQALTLFVEKIPKYLFDFGIIEYKGSRAEMTKEFGNLQNNSQFKGYLETDIFTQIILKYQSEIPRLVQQCIMVLLGSSTSNQQVKTAVDAIKRFKDLPNTNALNMKNPKIKAVDDFRRMQNCKNYNSLINSLKTATGHNVWHILLDLPDNNLSTLSKYLTTAQVIQERGINSNRFIIHVKKETFASICRAYVYVKALRNQSNHASIKENLNESDKVVLQKYGYSFENNSLETIRQNLKKAAKTVLDARLEAMKALK